MFILMDCYVILLLPLVTTLGTPLRYCIKNRRGAASLP
jgi:hypothetical protein